MTFTIPPFWCGVIATVICEFLAIVVYSVVKIVNVYSYDGDLIASYEGKLDLQENESKVLFDLDGKRYVYYNAVVEVIEK